MFTINEKKNNLGKNPQNHCRETRLKFSNGVKSNFYFEILISHQVTRVFQWVNHQLVTYFGFVKIVNQAKPDPFRNKVLLVYAPK